MAEVVDSHPPLTTADIEEVERRIGAVLPADLRDFYLRHNGGHLVPPCFVDDDGVLEVQLVLYMKSGNASSGFEETYEGLVLNTPEFPRGFIPFAVDQGGDYFLFSIRKEDYGSISFNQSEYYDDPERFVIFLAPSLKAFLDGMTDEDGG